ncbi:ABC transporter permease, partial [Micrococcus sp. SIMBA_131]
FEGLSPVVHIPLAIIAAALAGAIWAFVPGFLKAKYQVHEVITTIMMNYVALHVVNAIIRTYLLAPGERTDQINASASLQSPFLETITDFSRLHYGFVVAIIGAII